MDDPPAAMEANRRVYATLKEMLVPNELHRVQHQVRQILPHLVFLGATSYAILSESASLWAPVEVAAPQFWLGIWGW